MKYFVKLSFTVFVLVSILTSCVKNLGGNKGGGDPDIVGPTEYFDFTTVQQVSFDVKYDVPEGMNISFDIYAENPLEWNGTVSRFIKKGIESKASGITNGLGQYKMTRELPLDVKEVYIYTEDLFVPQLLKAKIVNGIVNPEVVDLQKIADQNMQDESSRAGNAKNFSTLGSWNSLGCPNYIDESKTLDYDWTAVRKVIGTTFFRGQKGPAEAYQDANIIMKQDAELWISLLWTPGTMHNVLGYICCTEDDLSNINSVADSRFIALEEIIIFPDAKTNVSDTQTDKALKEGQSVKLKYRKAAGDELKNTFPAGTVVVWVLRANGFLPSNATLKNPLNFYYSNSKWNPESDPNNRQHTLIYRTNNVVTVGFEDTLHESIYSDKTYTDIMFNIFSYPNNAFDTKEGIPELENKIASPSIIDTYKGTLAFEDNWPSQGDYDMNDVVISYVSKATINISSNSVDDYGRIANIKDVFTLKWTGAGVANGFAYQMPYDKSNIKSIKINGVDASSSLDADMNKATITVLQDAIAEIGNYANAKPKDFMVEIEFSNPIPVSEFNKPKYHAPYNPFIFSKDNRSKEVHLPKYYPTDKNDNSLFGTSQDKSKPGEGAYYISSDKYPFALHISGNVDFINKAEKVRIDVTYPRYSDWVINPSENADWHIK